MTRRQSQRGAVRASVAAVALLSMIVMTAPAEARGHDMQHRSAAHHGQGEASLASGRRHTNDTYVNAATQEEDKLLNTRIKSICRGC